MSRHDLLKYTRSINNTTPIANKPIPLVYHLKHNKKEREKMNASEGNGLSPSANMFFYEYILTEDRERMEVEKNSIFDSLKKVFTNHNDNLAWDLYPHCQLLGKNVLMFHCEGCEFFFHP